MHDLWHSLDPFQFVVCSICLRRHLKSVIINFRILKSKSVSLCIFVCNCCWGRLGEGWLNTAPLTSLNKIWEHAKIEGTMPLYTSWSENSLKNIGSDEPEMYMKIINQHSRFPSWIPWPSRAWMRCFYCLIPTQTRRHGTTAQDPWTSYAVVRTVTPKDTCLITKHLKSIRLNSS